MYEYQNGQIATGGFIGYTGNQKIARVVTEEKYENGRLVSKTVTTEYVYEPPQNFTVNVTNDKLARNVEQEVKESLEKIQRTGRSTGPHIHYGTTQ